jgi:hypothetical protein
MQLELEMSELFADVTLENHTSALNSLPGAPGCYVPGWQG